VTCVARSYILCEMLADNHTYRPPEDCPPAAVSAGRPQDWPLLWVWCCCTSAANGNLCPHRSLAGLHLVSQVSRTGFVIGPFKKLQRFLDNHVCAHNLRGSSCFYQRQQQKQNRPIFNYGKLRRFIIPLDHMISETQQGPTEGQPWRQFSSCFVSVLFSK
jgi:hypothetical protein